MLALRLTLRSGYPNHHKYLCQATVRAFHSNGTLTVPRERSREPDIGTTTPVPSDAPAFPKRSRYHLVSGYAGWAKRPTRPFPPPFFSPPSGSFSDPLSTHNRAPRVNGQMIRGITNGDDALLASEIFIGVNDGVGAWGQKERGCAPLWSRLILHFWALRAEEQTYGVGKEEGPDPVGYLDEAYKKTKAALSEPNEWLGTTTACSALLHSGGEKPVLFVTQLGDCKCLVVRPSLPTGDRVLFSTEEQWHYFDCPRQLGTNSPDEPLVNAVLSKIDIAEDDLVLAMSDGVSDNLWEHEIADTAVDSLNYWHETGKKDPTGGLDEGMRYVAQEIVLAARKIAEDPFATSPFMERAVDEGLAIEGGKLDDISVVAAICRPRSEKG